MMRLYFTCMTFMLVWFGTPTLAQTKPDNLATPYPTAPVIQAPHGDPALIDEYGEMMEERQEAQEEINEELRDEREEMLEDQTEYYEDVGDNADKLTSPTYTEEKLEEDEEGVIPGATDHPLGGISNEPAARNQNYVPPNPDQSLVEDDEPEDTVPRSIPLPEE
jgi:hypothetical protein